MRANATKRKLIDGQVAAGLINLSADPHITGTIAAAGYDYVMYDLEHSSLTLQGLEAAVRAADAAGITPLARVAGPAKRDILAVLEAGVRGIMVPAVESAAEAEAVVQAARYHPEGARGVYYLGYGSDYGAKPAAEYFADANRELLIIAQVETAEGVRHAGEIAAVPGIDATLVGPGDLSQALGVPWQFDHPTVIAAIEETFRATQAAGKIAGIMPPHIHQAERWVETGANLIIWAQDMQVFRRALLQDVDLLRERLGWQPRTV